MSGPQVSKGVVVFKGIVVYAAVVAVLIIATVTERRREPQVAQETGGD